MIWVAIALIFMLWLLVKDAPRRTMIRALSVIAVATIYGFSLTNVAQFIAAQNLKTSLSKANPDWLDKRYLRGLMPHGIAALNAHIISTGNDPLAMRWFPDPRRVESWRGWSLRTQKIKAATARYKQL